MKIVATHRAEEEFAEAYTLYADDIFRHCFYRVKNREKALETMQEAFTRTWQYIAKGNDIDNVRAFLYRSATNLIINDARRKKLRREDSLEQMQEDTGFDIEGDDGRDIHGKMDAAAAKEALDTLEEPYREALVMRFIDGMKPQEIADITGDTANVISVRINRGLKHLRTHLEQDAK